MNRGIEQDQGASSATLPTALSSGCAGSSPVPGLAADALQSTGAEFSPAPWTYDGMSLLDGNRNRVLFSGHIGLAIAPRPNGWPNDLLLLAAPDLFDALNDCVRAREAWIGSTTEEGDAAASAALSRAHKRARAALAKASGIVAATSGRDAQRLDERSEQSPVGEAETPTLPPKGASQ